MNQKVSKNELIDSIHAMSVEMLDHARAQNWEDVNTLEQQRAKLLKEFDGSNDVKSNDDLVNKLQLTIEINDEIQFLSKQEMNHCLQKCVAMKRGKKAFNAYAES